MKVCTHHAFFAVLDDGIGILERVVLAITVKLVEQLGGQPSSSPLLAPPCCRHLVVGCVFGSRGWIFKQSHVLKWSDQRSKKSPSQSVHCTNREGEQKRARAELRMAAACVSNSGGIPVGLVPAQTQQRPVQNQCRPRLSLSLVSSRLLVCPPKVERDLSPCWSEGYSRTSPMTSSDTPAPADVPSGGDSEASRQTGAAQDERELLQSSLSFRSGNGHETAASNRFRSNIEIVEKPRQMVVLVATIIGASYLVSFWQTV